MTNSFPLFIDIEASSPDENGFPISISWSLADGQLKSVLITAFSILYDFIHLSILLYALIISITNLCLIISFSVNLIMLIPFIFFNIPIA